jgi:NADPH-dependent curcumin reductase CurA
VRSAAIAGQIAKDRGAHVIGIAGGEEKCRPHGGKIAGSTPASTATRRTGAAQFDAATPNGVDVDFENVGGEVMDHVFIAAQPERPHHPLRDDLAVRRRRKPTATGKDRSTSARS